MHADLIMITRGAELTGAAGFRTLFKKTFCWRVLANNDPSTRPVDIYEVTRLEEQCWRTSGHLLHKEKVELEKFLLVLFVTCHLCRTDRSLFV